MRRYAIWMSVAVMSTLLTCAAGAQEQLRLAPQLGLGEVKGVAVSPDGREVVTAAGNLAWLWDAQNGRQLRAFVGHTSDVTSVAFATDGRRVLTGSEDHTARLWDAETGKLLRKFETEYGAQIRTVAISPDGRTLAAGGESGEAVLWDAESGKLLHTLSSGAMEVLAIAFSPNGRFVLTGNLNDTAILWDSATGSEVRAFGTIYHSPKSAPGQRTIEGIVPDQHPKWVSSVAFSPDGKFIAAGNVGGSVQIYVAATGKEAQTFGSNLPVGMFQDSIDSVVFSPDGKTLLAGGKPRARLFDVESGDEVRTFGGPGTSPRWAAFSADGMRVFAGGEHSAAMWEVASGELLRAFVGHTQPIRSAVFSADGQRIATGGDDGTARVWEAAAGRETLALSDDWFQVNKVAFTPDGRALLASDKSKKAVLWDTTSGQTIHAFEDESNSISGDGRFVITSHAGEKSGATLWDTPTGNKLRTYEPPAELNFSYMADSADIFRVTAFSSDGHSLIAATGDASTAEVWDTVSGREEHGLENTVLSEAVSAVDLSWDGKIALTGDMAGHVRVWDAATGTQVRVFAANSDPVQAVALAPDEQTLLAGSWDHTARLWDRANGKQLREFDGHAGWVESVAFSPDGKFALTGSDDTMTKLWDTATGKELATLLSFENGGWAVVDPQGRFDTSDLDGGAPLAWVASSEPMRALPLEIFMRDYYTPRLLALVLSGEPLPAVRPISEIKNRAQPEVVIMSINASKTTLGRVDVVVHAASHTDERGQMSGLEDLRLFRNGQMVGFRAGPLKDSDFTFTNVQLSATAKQATFTAYAFSGEHIKSVTAEKSFAYEVAAKRKPRAWLLQIGVNHYQAGRCELHGSANDARGLSKSLSEKLAARGMDVKETLLISNDTESAATKAGIRNALAEIAAQAMPDDAFFLSFSGHGYGDKDGQFYLLPSDVQGSCAGVNETMLRGAVSADELAEWLQPIDAGEMTFVLDACDSASSVEANAFKPGPMGSRGLGQLAYDKRMRILAASQANQAARESAELGQGLLSYALVQQGLIEGKADWKPVDKKITLGEWLSYAAIAVPKILQSGSVKTERGTTVIGQPARSVKSVQTPAVFDFSRQDGFVLEMTGVANK